METELLLVKACLTKGEMLETFLENILFIKETKEVFGRCDLVTFDVKSTIFLDKSITLWWSATELSQFMQIPKLGQKRLNLKMGK